MTGDELRFPAVKPVVPDQRGGACARERVRAALVAGVVLAVLAAGLRWPVLWAYARVEHLEPAFFDTYPYLVGLDQLRAGVDPYSARAGDPWRFHHVNGPAWFWLAPLGCGVAQAPLFGWLSAGALAGALAALCRPPHGVWALGLLAALLSPPVLLGLERANNDLLLFGLVVLAAALAAPGSRWRGILGLGVVALATAGKYHVGAAFVLVLAAADRGVARWWWAALVAFVVGLALVLARDPVFVGAAWPDAGSPGMFGLPGLLQWTGFSSGESRRIGILTGAGVAAALLAWRWRRNPWWGGSAVLPTRAWAAAAGFAVLVGSYFAAGSHPYRLIWCLPAFAVAMTPAGVLTPAGTRLRPLWILVGSANLLWYYLAPLPPASPSLALALGFQLVSAAHVLVALAALADLAVARLRLLRSA